MNWPTKKISDCIEKLAKKSSIPLKRYQKSGKFPIIDQGQGFIGGYTDDELIVYKDRLPVIVFGDHTRTIKCIDFPFATGADGTKVLKLNDFLDTKYFYFVLMNLNIESRGYARHFHILKEREILVPPIGKQKGIVDRLDAVQNAQKQNQKLIDLAEELFQSTLERELQSKSDWQTKKLSELISVPKKKVKGIAKLKYQRVGLWPIIDQGAENIAGYTASKESVYSGPTPVIVFGDHTRIFKYIDFPFAPGSDGTKILIPISNFDPKFIFFALLSKPIKNLGYSRHFRLLKQMKYFVPPFFVQQRIVERLDGIREYQNQLKKQKELLQELFNSLLERLLNPETCEKYI
jgi:type I restriction enzyme S subunit